jgi:hypothetical protein
VEYICCIVVQSQSWAKKKKKKKSKTLSRKYPTPKRAGLVAQVVQCLHSKLETPVPPKPKPKQDKSKQV